MTILTPVQSTPIPKAEDAIITHKVDEGSFKELQMSAFTSSAVSEWNMSTSLLPGMSFAPTG